MSERVSHVGVVQSVAAGEALVAVPTQGCAGCGQRSGCGVGQLAGRGRTTLVRVAAPARIKAGDTVTLDVAQDALHRAALVGYLVPALTMVAGALAGEWAGLGEAGPVAGSVLGLALGVLAVRWLPRLARSVTAPLAIKTEE